VTLLLRLDAPKRRARPQPPRFPDALEAAYRRRILRRLDALRHLLDARLSGARTDQLDHVSPTTHHDAAAGPPRPPAIDMGRFRDIVRGTRQAWEIGFPPELDDLARQAAAVDAFATGQQIRVIEQLVAVDVTRGGRADLRALHREWARVNVDLIKSIESKYFDEITDLVVRQVQDGRVDLQKIIADRYGVSRSRAKLIARDQTAKLNSRITERRQRELGVTRYVWSTSGDERVRPEHQRLDGKTRRWDDPHPTEGHPGWAVQCRCTAAPVLDDEDEG
jgi:SPP1 gp7 family putative phage head morphogenesis protein